MYYVEVADHRSSYKSMFSYNENAIFLASPFLNQPRVGFPQYFSFRKIQKASKNNFYITNIILGLAKSNTVKLNCQNQFHNINKNKQRPAFTLSKMFELNFERKLANLMGLSTRDCRFLKFFQKKVVCICH